MEMVANSVSQHLAENSTIAVRLGISRINVQIIKKAKETVGLEKAEMAEKYLKESVDSATSRDIKQRIAGRMRKCIEAAERMEKEWRSRNECNKQQSTVKWGVSVDGGE